MMKKTAVSRFAPKQKINIFRGDVVLFHTFHSQKERKNYGDSSFIEIQFCKLPPDTPIKRIVAAESINHWQDDSLYINDEDTFFSEYRNIFSCGTYNNLESGTVDIYGINYYAPSLTNFLIEKLFRDKPTDYEVLIKWLNKSKAYHGFYILGI